MSAEAALAGATVLVVDDHEPNLALMHRVLRAAGVTELSATDDPHAVLPLFHTVQPDIVLLDLHMPGLDGIAVMNAIRDATPIHTFVPIIVITADATLHARDRVLHAGADDFLTKPIDQTEVVLRVRNLLRTRALHEQLRGHSLQLQAEVDATRAAEERARCEHEAKRSRVLTAIETHPPRTLYQPIVELATNTIAGYEALARFDQHPRRPPNEWFDEATQVGLGVELELVAVDIRPPPTHPRQRDAHPQRVTHHRDLPRRSQNSSTVTGPTDSSSRSPNTPPSTTTPNSPPPSNHSDTPAPSSPSTTPAPDTPASATSSNSPPTS